jgi:hypothetical protein
LLFDQDRATKKYQTTLFDEMFSSGCLKDNHYKIILLQIFSQKGCFGKLLEGFPPANKRKDLSAGF